MSPIKFHDFTVGQKIEKGPKKIIKSAIEKTREIEIL